MEPGDDADPADVADQPVSPDPTRTGAVWVTATGAFLLLAGAAVFVAVQWGSLSPFTKFLILAFTCAGSLAFGRLLRGPLPATARVVFHLGAFLLPILTAAALANFEQPWNIHLIGQGLVAAVAFFVLSRVERSDLLEWSAAAGVIVLTTGLGATRAGSAPGGTAALLLVGCALVASLVGARRPAVAWALVAGLAPLLALAGRFASIESTALNDLGLVGSHARLTSIIVGLTAAFVLGRAAHQERDLSLVALALLSATIGIVTTSIELRTGADVAWTSLAALFVLVELVVLLVQDDSFWGKPARLVAGAFEILAGVCVALWTFVALLDIVSPFPTGSFHENFVPLVAGLLGGVAWFVADLRRRATDRTPAGIALLVGAGWLPASLGIAGAVLAGAVLGTPSLAVAGGVLIALAAFFVLSGRPAGHALTAVLCTAAPLLAHEQVSVGIAYAVVGAGLLTWAVRLRARTSGSDGVAVHLLAAAILLPLAAGVVVAATDLPLAPTLAVAAALAWSIGLVLDASSRLLGWIPRAGSALVLACVADLSPAAVACLSIALTFASIADALHRRDRDIAVIGAITSVYAVGATVLALGGTWPMVGVALCASAVVAGMLSNATGEPWRLVALIALVLHGSTGLALAALEPEAFGFALILLGLAGAQTAWRHGVNDAMLAATALISIGIWIDLAAFGITAADAYIAPLAGLLLLAGWNGRRARKARPELEPVGSWLAYGPGLLLLVGAAMIERIATHDQIHALVAGAVGVAAVLIGGSRRLAGPLLIGTATLVVVTGYEAFSAGARVPTWAWLSAGGTVLVAAGIWMERHDRGPIETGRRLVDVVHERFT